MDGERFDRLTRLLAAKSPRRRFVQVASALFASAAVGETDAIAAPKRCREVAARCSKGKHCCSGVCIDRRCAPPSCSDGVRNGAETDVDCGGTCPVCVDGSACTVNADCASLACTNSVCVPCAGATCPDGCFNLTNDPDHCGSCFTVCSDQNASRRCIAGACDPICDTGYADCDGNPVNGCEAYGSCNP